MGVCGYLPLFRRRHRRQRHCSVRYRQMLRIHDDSAQHHIVRLGVETCCNSETIENGQQPWAFHTVSLNIFLCLPLSWVNRLEARFLTTHCAWCPGTYGTIGTLRSYCPRRGLSSRKELTFSSTFRWGHIQGRCHDAFSHAPRTDFCAAVTRTPGQQNCSSSRFQSAMPTPDVQSSLMATFPGDRLREST